MKRLQSICFVMRRYDSFIERDDWKEIIIRQYQWTAHLAKQGVKVTFIQGGKRNEVFKLPFGKIHVVEDANRTSPFKVSSGFFNLTSQILDDMKCDLVICQGLSDIYSFWKLKKVANSEIKFLAQDHASVYKPIYSLYSYFFRKMDGVLFNSPGQEKDWTSKVIKQSQVYFLPEGTSSFHFADQINSSPPPLSLLWIGNLDSNKDPITILKGIGKVVKQHPDLRLTMIYRQAPLLIKVEAHIADLGLSNNVKLQGEIQHSSLDKYFEDNQFIVSGSGKEGSGYSVIEAMSFGVIPILTKIPSFNHFTDNGRYGFHFDRGEVDSLAATLTQALSSNNSSLRFKVRQNYLQHFSPEAMANQLLKIYKQL